MSKSSTRLVAAVTVALFGLFFFWPLWQVLRGGLLDTNGRFTGRYVGVLLSDPTYLEGLRNAFLLATTATLLSFILALPLAWLTERTQFPGRRLLSNLLLAPLILPPFVGAIGVRQIFGQYGALNALLHRGHFLESGATIDWLGHHRFWAVAIVEALSLYPIVYLNIAAALGALDPGLEEAAANLGSTRLRRWCRVTLPLIRPGLFAGGTIVFIWSFTELGTPLVFDFTRVTSVQVYEGLKDIGSNPFPYALVAVMLFCAVAAYVVGRNLLGRGPVSSDQKATSRAQPRLLTGGKAWAATAVVGGTAFLALLPHVGVVLTAFAGDWYGTVVPATWTSANLRLALGDDLTVPAIINSVRYSLASTAVDLVLGVSIAYVVVRTKSYTRHLLDVVAMLPLAVPGLVLAFGYVAMAAEGKTFAFLNPAKNPTWLLIIAYSIRRLPYVVRSAAAGFEQTSVTLEEAAQNLGAPPLKIATRITLPLIWPSIVAGVLLTFAFAMLEVSDSLILAQKQAFYPITKAILELLQMLGDGKFIACALGAWAMLFLAAIMLAISCLRGRKLNSVLRL